MTLTRNRILLAAAGAAAVAVAAFGVWYAVLRDDAPPPASLDDAVGSVAEATAAPDAASTPAPAAEATSADGDASTPAATAAAGGGGGLTGRWTISEEGETFVGYRVREELASIGATTAVGRTSAVTGSLVFDGAAITSVEVEADVSLLESDDSRRDRAIQSRGLESRTYPTASFSLTEPIALGGVPAEGETIEAEATGLLTIHGETREVTLALEGVLRGGLAFVVGSTEIVFADYGMEAPTAVIVLSIEDRGTLEFQLVFERAP